MRIRWVINLLASKDRLVAECVDESCATYLRPSKLSDVRMHEVPSSPVPDCPHTIIENWMIFFDVFFLRILSCH